ncbi:MAG TPA: hypothetical protein VK576_00685, partial [Thermoleophilia bacterium]|nr:hypothetical protein [Thermoleophilia bacterium]
TASIQSDTQIPIDLTIAGQGAKVHLTGSIRDASTSWVAHGTGRVEQVVTNVQAQYTAGADGVDGRATFTSHGLVTMRLLSGHHH